MTKLPEPHKEEFKELTEEEVTKLHKLENMNHKDIIDKFIYLINAGLIGDLLKSTYESGNINLFNTYMSICTMIILNRVNKLSKYYMDDIYKYASKLINKLPQSLNPFVYTAKFLKSKGFGDNIKRIPKRSYMHRNNHLLVDISNSSMYPGDDEVEIPRKIIINRGRKKNIKSKRNTHT